MHHGFALAFFYFNEDQDFDELLQLITIKDGGKEKLNLFIQQSEEHNFIDKPSTFLTKDQKKID